MRTRFNLDRLCSSDNYILSKKIHREDLKRNHENNHTLFMAISTPSRPKTSLELFEEGVKKSIELFKKNYAN